jgi:hypothetical protein
MGPKLAAAVAMQEGSVRGLSCLGMGLRPRAVRAELPGHPAQPGEGNPTMNARDETESDDERW